MRKRHLKKAGVMVLTTALALSAVTTIMPNTGYCTIVCASSDSINNSNTKLEIENSVLKTENKELKNTNTELEVEMGELEAENKELKNRVKELEGQVAALDQKASQAQSQVVYVTAPAEPEKEEKPESPAEPAPEPDKPEVEVSAPEGAGNISAMLDVDEEELDDSGTDDSQVTVVQSDSDEKEVKEDDDKGKWFNWIKQINWQLGSGIVVLIIAATTGVVWYVKKHKKKDEFDENEI